MALQMKSQICLPARGVARTRAVLCKAQSENVADRVKSAALAATIAGALLVSPMVAPPDAEAARSGGRVSSSGFSSRRAAPPARSAPATSNTTVINRTTVVAAPSPFGFGMPFFGGWGFGPTFIMPFPFFGGLIQIMFLLLIVNVVFGIVKGAVNAANSAGKKKDDGDWDSL